MMTVNELAKAVSGELLCAADKADEPVRGCYIGDLLSFVMGRAREADCWITIMTNINVIGVAVLADVACVVLAEDVKPDDNMLERAVLQGIPLISTEKTAFECAALISKTL